MAVSFLLHCNVETIQILKVPCASPKVKLLREDYLALL